MSFGDLLVIALAGLGGPLLGLSGRWFVPVTIGEVLAGVLIGNTGLGAIAPHGATLAFLANVGFAMLMLTAGMHLPLRDRRLLASLRRGAGLAVLCGALAVPAGMAAAAIAGTSHAAIYAVVLASGSVAVLVPALQETGAGGREVLTVMAQVTIADIVTIVSVPIVLQPSRTGHAILGGALVAAAALLLLGAARLLAHSDWVGRTRRLSEQRHWALDLRVALLVLFFLAWLAQRSGTSVLIAGFGAGGTVALIGGPERLSTQIRGVADGFFVPLYFVVLGAELDLSGLVEHPAMLALAAALAGLNVALHLAAALLWRLPPGAGLAASAQLGVPAAVASLGLSQGVLSGEVAAAIVAASLVSLGVCTLGVELLLRRERGHAPTRTLAR
ncbi:MAG TPA: cation:proton antiporter [Solirubrobacteraceae bacterium]|jgi:Kef-type K+ transport system membrane component KefB|nr:cation:proton antiporter [Solirubrobacteraceae bacterium]